MREFDRPVGPDHGFSSNESLWLLRRDHSRYPDDGSYRMHSNSFRFCCPLWSLPCGFVENSICVHWLARTSENCHFRDWWRAR